MLDENGDVIETTTTDGQGVTTSLQDCLHTYSVQFVLPTGSTFTDANQGGDDDTDSDAGNDGTTATTTLAAGDFDDSLDAGLIFPATIGDYVWEDEDGDGQQDANESGIPGDSELAG
ncbi:MAG: SdrD B-like domain-containing protein [Saprospiraceae bacterium]